MIKRKKNFFLKVLIKLVKNIHKPRKNAIIEHIFYKVEMGRKQNNFNQRLEEEVAVLWECNSRENRIRGVALNFAKLPSLMQSNVLAE